MLKNLRKKKKGFTLIELIIVIAILAILAAVAIPRLGSMTGKANKSADIASAKTIANAATILIAEGDTEITSSDDSREVSTIESLTKYLQSVPSPKTTDGDFYITVDGDKIVVTIGEYDSENLKNVYFPEQ